MEALASPDTREASRSSLDRLSRLKQLQKKSAGESSGRQLDRRRAEKEADVIAELMPSSTLSAQLDRVNQLLHVLTQADFTAEDAEAVRSIKSHEQGVAIIKTLEEACASRWLVPPTNEEWLFIKKHQKEDADFAERQARRELAAQRADTGERLLKGLPIHESELGWVKGMLEAVDAVERDRVKAEWLQIYNDASLPLEGDRYREANLHLLREAMKASPESARAVAKATTGKKM